MRWFTDFFLRQMGLCLIIIIFLSGTALAQAVKGCVKRQTQNGQTPAVYVPVILQRPAGKITSYTDPEGWYYFYNVAPGSYTVSIQNTQNVPLIPVRVNNTGEDVYVPLFVIP